MDSTGTSANLGIVLLQQLPVSSKGKQWGTLLRGGRTEKYCVFVGTTTVRKWPQGGPHRESGRVDITGFEADKGGGKRGGVNFKRRHRRLGTTEMM